MNSFQELWWKQAKSDFDMFEQLRRQGAAPCHILHYLQMSTEKLAKAYFWQNSKPPVKNHVVFVRFLKSLLQSNQKKKRDEIARLFGYHRFAVFQSEVRRTVTISRQLERLAPDPSADGPNAEYPWPHNAPTNTPTTFQFPTWAELNDTATGRILMRIIKSAILQFSHYAHL